MVLSTPLMSLRILAPCVIHTVMSTKAGDGMPMSRITTTVSDNAGITFVESIYEKAYRQSTRVTVIGNAKVLSSGSAKASDRSRRSYSVLSQTRLGVFGGRIRRRGSGSYRVLGRTVIQPLLILKSNILHGLAL